MLDSLNSIPGVGQVKSFVHLATGNQEEADKAFKTATRSTLIMSGGAVGMLAGPVGAATLGAAVGTIWDTAESIITDEATGIIKNVENIEKTASEGKLPVKEVLQTAVDVAVDANGGLGALTWAKCPLWN